MAQNYVMPRTLEYSTPQCCCTSQQCAKPEVLHALFCMMVLLYWYYSDFDDYGKANGKGGAGGYLADFVTRSSKDSVWKAAFLRNSFNNRSKTGFFFSSDYSFEYDWRPNDKANRK